MRDKSASGISWISKVSGSKKIYILCLLVVQGLLGISGVVSALLLRGIIDGAVSGDGDVFTCFALLFILLILAQIALRAINRFLDEFTRSTMENILKKRLFDALLKKDYGMVARVHSGEWMNRLTSDTVVVADGMAQILPGIAGMAVKLSGAVIALVALEARFLYVLIPGGIALIFLTYFFRKNLKKLHKDIQERDGELRVFLQERLGSMMIVRTFSREEDTLEIAGKHMAQHKKARIRRNLFSNVCNIGFGLAMHGAYAFGAVFCGYGILKGSMSYGTFTAVLQLINQVQNPFANITGYLPKYYAMIASAERLIEAENYSDDCKGSKSREELDIFYKNEFRALGLKGVSFTYMPPSDEKSELQMPIVLSDFNLEIKKGEYVAFTGPSGCGKSTVLKLLMCLYTQDEGERYLELKNGGRVELDSAYRGLFAYVPQGNQLLSGTIREILTFGDKKDMEKDAELWSALDIACAKEFVESLEKGLDTLLGERGAGLSEGQMQRIAIARAIFSGHPILMLDEATSSLDEETEDRLLNNLKSMTDKTVLIITHRPRALKICDKCEKKF